MSGWRPAARLDQRLDPTARRRAGHHADCRDLRPRAGHDELAYRCPVGRPATSRLSTPASAANSRVGMTTYRNAATFVATRRRSASFLSVLRMCPSSDVLADRFVVEVDEGGRRSGDREFERFWIEQLDARETGAASTGRSSSAAISACLFQLGCSRRMCRDAKRLQQVVTPQVPSPAKPPALTEDDPVAAHRAILAAFRPASWGARDGARVRPVGAFGPNARYCDVLADGASPPAPSWDGAAELPPAEDGAADRRRRWAARQHGAARRMAGWSARTSSRRRCLPEQSIPVPRRRRQGRPPARSSRSSSACA